MPLKLLPQNSLMNGLRDAVTQYPRTEKILIVPDRATGNHLLQNLTRSGTSWINFDVRTVPLLAAELVEEHLISEKLQAISSIGAQALVDSVFNELADSNQLKYFEKQPINKGIVEALTRTLRELRLNGITSDDLKKSSFINPLKWNDLQLIVSKFEKALEEQKLVDNACLIMMALECLKKGGVQTERTYFIVSRYYMRGLEREFVEKLCGKKLHVIKEDPAIGLPIPSDAWPAGENIELQKCESDTERLRWLFKSTKAPAPFKDGTIEIFNAIGYRNEVREVLRRISAEGATVDDAEILYTNVESYADLLYSLCEKLKIPATFSEGKSACLTSAGRSMLGFLLWVKEDFNEKHLRHILESSGLKWKDSSKADLPGWTTLGFLLRTSGVGWGRDRYPLVLDGKIRENAQEAADLRKEGETEAAEWKEKKARNFAHLKALCEYLLKLVPPRDENGKVDFGKFCDACVLFLGANVRKADDSDAAFIEIAKERLVMLGTLIKGPILFDEAMDKVFNLVSTIRVGASGPAPGHLHVSHYRSGGRSGRNRTFIAGLDEGKFPARAGQDPVLLDEERKKISDGLELSSERMSRNIYEMASLAAGLRGKVTFSYSAYDIKEDRKVFPSSVLLQVFRIKEGIPKADYDMMFKALGEPIGFDEGPTGRVILDETDWWLNKLVEKGVLKDGTEMVQNTYEGLKEGLYAQQMRSTDRLTIYDGKITPQGSELDPRQNNDMIMSCSRLESAAKCPFAYFVENVLGIRKPDEVKKDMAAWLEAADRGKLLHEVFQIFVTMIIEEKKRASASKEKEAIETILDEIIKKYRDIIPPPSDVVFRNECLHLKRDLGIFLQINKELGTEPVGTEVSFGDKEDAIVKIPLGNNTHISLRGKIDRIDKAGPSEYHLWDYKTGSTFAHKESGYIAGGEQMQHALYAVAAEEILKKSGEARNPKVTVAGYLFPTEKGTRDGKGGKFPRPQSDKNTWQEAMNKLLDIIETGTFIVNSENGCKFCDYGDICGGETAQDHMTRKLENMDNKALAAWTALKEYK